VLKKRGGAYWYSAGFNVPAWVAWVIGVALAIYWTRISPLSFGATVPVFVLTFVLYLAVRFGADRVTRRQSVSETDRGVE
jgi:NCS1 family nucleobase:cation symporter-1